MNLRYQVAEWGKGTESAFGGSNRWEVAKCFFESDWLILLLGFEQLDSLILLLVLLQ